MNNKTNKLAIIALIVSGFGINQAIAQGPTNGAKPSTVVTTTMPASVSKVGVASEPSKTTVTVTPGVTINGAKPGVTTSVVSTPASTVVTSTTATPVAGVNGAKTEAETQPNLVTATDISKNAKPVETTLKKIGEIKARIDEIKLLQDLKEAEYKLSQPVEDKKKDLEKNALNANMSAMGNIVAPNFNPVLKGTNANPNTGMGLASPEMQERSVTVYSVIGFDGDYSAKVSLDGKSTYTVKKGDVLPDGQMVTEINRYYIVLAEKSAIGRPLAEPQRVYVTGRPLASTSTNNSNTATAPRAGSSAPSNFIGTMPSSVVAPTPNTTVPMGIPPRSAGTIGAAAPR